MIADEASTSQFYSTALDLTNIRRKFSKVFGVADSAACNKATQTLHDANVVRSFDTQLVHAIRHI